MFTPDGPAVIAVGALLATDLGAAWRFKARELPACGAAEVVGPEVDGTVTNCTSFCLFIGGDSSSGVAPWHCCMCLFNSPISPKQQ